ncbi:MAG: hypothetical protein R2800_14180 [Flavipsychrobacter sp.]
MNFLRQRDFLFSNAEFYKYLPADRAKLISDTELHITKRKGRYAIVKYFRLSVLVLLYTIVLGFFFIVWYLGLQEQLKQLTSPLVVVTLLFTWNLYRQLYPSRNIHNRLTRVIKGDGTLEVNGVTFAVDNSTGVYADWESTGKHTGYFAIGLVLREPHSIKRYPIMSCERYELTTYTKVITDFTGLEYEEKAPMPTSRTMDWMMRKI